MKFSILSIFIFLFFISFQVLSQASYTQSIADAEYSKEHYYVAQKYYEEIVLKDSLNDGVQRKLADCYRKLLNYPKVEVLV